MRFSPTPAAILAILVALSVEATSSSASQFTFTKIADTRDPRLTDFGGVASINNEGVVAGVQCERSPLHRPDVRAGGGDQGRGCLPGRPSA
jgi:hypothetical protein